MLGALPGVAKSRAGWLAGEEVVEVHYDPKVTSFAELLKASRCVEKPSTAFAYEPDDFALAKKTLGKKAVLTEKIAKDAKPSDRRHYLRRSPFWLLPMTELQSLRTNSFLAKPKNTKSRDVKSVFSPRQLQLLAILKPAWADSKRREALADLQPARRAADFADYETRLRERIKTSKKN